MYVRKIGNVFSILLILFGFNTTFAINAISDDNKPLDVIIIGAGFAGLGAALKLNQSGLNYIILEARNRVGGRVHTVQPWGTATDLGASWIHKVNDNPLATLAKDNNIPVLSTQYSHDNAFSMLESAIIYDEAGKQIDRKRLTKARLQNMKFIKYLDKHASSYSNEIAVTQILQDYLKQTPMDKDSLDLLVHLNGDAGEFENGANLSTTSYKIAQEIESTTSGGDVVFTNGYSQLLALLTKNTPILLNQRVTKVDYSSNLVTVHTNDRVYKARYVISTLPLGILKAGTVQFLPPLPPEKQNAIKHIGMGVFNKAYLLFDKPFWDKSTEWFVFLSKQNNPKEDFEVLNYYSKTQQPILLFFTTGEFAANLEKKTDRQIVDRIMETLRMIYGNDIPYPTSYLITHWGIDPYSRGSFSYPRIGSSGEDYKVLAQPIRNKVFFAGEATFSADPSTVTGAFVSGINAAREISRIDTEISR